MSDSVPMKELVKVYIVPVGFSAVKMFFTGWFENAKQLPVRLRDDKIFTKYLAYS